MLLLECTAASLCRYVPSKFFPRELPAGVEAGALGRRRSDSRSPPARVDLLPIAPPSCTYRPPPAPQAPSASTSTASRSSSRHVSRCVRRTRAWGPVLHTTHHTTPHHTTPHHTTPRRFVWLRLCAVPQHAIDSNATCARVVQQAGVHEEATAVPEPEGGIGLVPPRPPPPPPPCAVWPPPAQASKPTSDDSTVDLMIAQPPTLGTAGERGCELRRRIPFEGVTSRSTPVLCGVSHDDKRSTRAQQY